MKYFKNVVGDLFIEISKLKISIYPKA